MRRNIILKISIGIVAFVLLFMLLTTLFIEPWAAKKIQTAFNKSSDKYHLEIGKVNISIIKSGIELEDIVLSPKLQNDSLADFKGEIASVKLMGIKLFKVLFKNDIDVREVNIFNSHFAGELPLQEKKPGPAKLSPLNISIDSLVFDRLVVNVKDRLTSQAYSLNDAVLKVYDIQVAKQDTISPEIIRQFDFNAQKYASVSADSMYTMTAIGIDYAATSNSLSVDSFSVHPNYSNYEFTDRDKFETDRIEAGLNQIVFHDFSAIDFIKSGSLTSSYIEIGKLEMNIFRDKRKEFNHVNKPAFQDMLYNYPEKVNIDSIGILFGNVTYTEHAEGATEPGVIRFNELNALVFNITNDTIYKTEKAYLGFNAEALLMGKAKMTVQMKGRLFDGQNTFAVNGNLSGMEVMELNPMLEKNAFIYATAGRIYAMNFSFTANNTKSSGQMNLRYDGLNVAVKNKQTDDTTAVKERVISVIANMKIMNSNPIPGEELRQGVIDFERDPEKSFFNYCAKSIISGMKSSVLKTPETRKESRKQRRDK
ncbi:MAG: hypothetical protein K0M40_05955 [Prolixibacteraceae bacterium]|nr:hypothetical protein [Prolixibacteraceae bacterium]